MDRRSFLRSLSVVGATGLLTACGRAAAPAAPATSKPTADPVARVAPGAERTLSVVSGSFEQLVGSQRPFAFGVYRQTEEGAEPLAGADIELHVVTADGESTGPTPTTFHEIEGNPLGVYVATVTLTRAGVTSFVAVTADGEAAGSETLEVVEPQASALPAPTDAAIAVPTPTTRRHLGFAEICTRDPDCGMHAVSLDDALERGRPVALAFATPAYCQTAVCGPVVDVLDGVRTDRNWGDVAFVHCEIYEDAGQTLAQPVARWDLPSEPWVFAIRRDGTIAARADGPLMTLPDYVADLIEQARSE